MYSICDCNKGERVPKAVLRFLDWEAGWVIVSHNTGKYQKGLRPGGKRERRGGFEFGAPCLREAHGRDLQMEELLVVGSQS